MRMNMLIEILAEHSAGFMLVAGLSFILGILVTLLCIELSGKNRSDK